MVAESEDLGEEIPASWEKYDIPKMVSEGWRARIKWAKNRPYLTMRFGDQERGLGVLDDRKLELFKEMYPNLAGSLARGRLKPPKRRDKILTTPLKRPEEIGSSYQPSLETLNWYHYFKNNGFTGSLGDFVNDVVYNFFREKNWKLAIVKGPS